MVDPLFCRVIGEQNGLPYLLVLLFQSLISRKDSAWLGNAQTSESFTSVVKREWEYAFAVEICEQYSSSTWLSSLVMLLQTISKEISSKQSFFQMRLVLEFIFQKLQDPEFAFAVSLEPRNSDTNGIQVKPVATFCVIQIVVKKLYIEIVYYLISLFLCFIKCSFVIRFVKFPARTTGAHEGLYTSPANC